MFVLANLLTALAAVFSILINILALLIFIRALISWVNPDPYNIIVRFLQNSTDPLLAPFRKVVPPWKLGIDLSPFLAILFLYFLGRFLVPTLNDLSFTLR